MKKILVVDDEDNIRQMYAEEFAELGYSVEEAADGIAALRLLEEHYILSIPFSLVTLDMRRPGMDGIETLNRIKQKWTNLPIIICTAYGEFKNDFGSWCKTALN